MLKTIIKTFGVVVASSLILGVIGAVIGGNIPGQRGEWAPLGGIFTGTAIGFLIGIFIGLFLVKRFIHYQGSILSGVWAIIVAGVIVGVILLIIDLFNFRPLGSVSNSPGWTIACILFVVLGPVLVVTLGFHLRYRKGKD